MWLVALGAVLGVVLGAPPAPPATLAFVGDINFRGLERTRDLDTIFAAVRPTLERADYAVGNLEGLLLDDPVDAFREARINITASSRFVAALATSGLDVFGLANNHTWDHGESGLLEHLGHMDRAGAAYFGAGRTDEAARAAHRVELPVGCVAIVPATFKSNKKTPRTAEPQVFAATYSIDDPGPLVTRLAAERARGCFVVAYVHAGKERSPKPTRAVQVAFRTLAAVADLVVGHHPHVLEGVELTASGAIAYSLGNFVFLNTDADKRRSAVLEVDLVRGAERPTLAAIRMVPVTIDAKTYLPRPATPAETQATAKILAERSRGFGTIVNRVDDLIVFAPPPR